MPVRRFPWPLLLTILTLVGFFGCDLLSSHAMDPAPGASDAVPTELRADTLVSHTLVGHSGSPDSVAWPVKFDSGFTYDIVVHSGMPNVPRLELLQPAGVDPFEVLESTSEDHRQRLVVNVASTRIDTIRFVSDTVHWVSVWILRSEGTVLSTRKPDAFEYDDSPEHATLLPTDSTPQEHSIHSTGDSAADVDWFRIASDFGSPSNLYVQTRLIDAPLHVKVVRAGSTVWEGNLKTWHATTPPAPYSGQQPVVRLEAAGESEYLVGVSGAVPGVYRIAASRIDRSDSLRIPDRFEPDNVLSSATWFPIDVAMLSRTLHGVPGSPAPPDQDWFAIDCDSGWTYEVMTKPSPDYSSDFSIDVFDADSVLVPGSFEVGHGYGSLDIDTTRFHVLRSGRHFIRLKGWHMGYSIKFRGIPGVPYEDAPDPYEPDDAPSSAKTIPADSSWQRRTLHVPPGATALDSDVVAVQVDSGRTYRFLVQEFALKGMEYSLRDQAGHRVATLGSKDSLGTILEFPVVRKGTCYLTIKAHGNRGIYRISAVSHPGFAAGVTVPPNDPMEPDSTRSLGHQLAVDGSTIERSVQLDDDDWMWFDGDSGVPIELDLSLTSRTDWVGYEVTDSDSNSVLGGGLEWGNPPKIQVLTPKRKGRYFLHVYPGYGYRNSDYLQGMGPFSLYKVRLSTLRRDSVGTLADAQPLGPENTWTAIPLADSKDTRVLKLTVQAGRTYLFKASLNSPQVRGLVLLDQDSTVLDRIPGADTYDAFGWLHAAATKDAVWYLRAASPVDGDSATVRPGLVHWVSYLTGANEPQNDRYGSSPRVASVPATIEGIVAVGDQDIYRIPLDSGTTYRISGFASSPGVGAGISSDSDGTFSYGEGDSRYVSARKSAIFFLRLTMGGMESSFASYRYTVEPVTQDPNEPDNDWAKASALVPKSATWSGTLTSGDTDWVSIDLDTGDVGYPKWQTGSGQPIQVDLFRGSSSSDPMRIESNDTRMGYLWSGLAYAPWPHEKVYLRITHPESNPDEPYCEYKVWWSAP